MYNFVKVGKRWKEASISVFWLLTTNSLVTAGKSIGNNKVKKSLSMSVLGPSIGKPSLHMTGKIWKHKGKKSSIVVHVKILKNKTSTGKKLGSQNQRSVQGFLVNQNVFYSVGFIILCALISCKKYSQRATLFLFRALSFGSMFFGFMLIQIKHFLNCFSNKGLNMRKEE